MIMLLFRAATLFCSSGLINDFLAVLVASGLVALVYRLFTVKEVYHG